MNRYLVVLDEFGMPTDILEDREAILKFLENELNTKTTKRQDKEDSRRT